MRLLSVRPHPFHSLCDVVTTEWLSHSVHMQIPKHILAIISAVVTLEIQKGFHVKNVPLCNPACQGELRRSGENVPWL